MEASLNKIAFSATLHCLAGCAIGEVLGMIISTAIGWAAFSSIALSVALAFFFGYLLSARQLLRSHLSLRQALRIAFLADTASITVMEIVDNGFILAVPGAIHASLDSILFWASLIVSLIVAFAVAYPVNRWLIARGKGHAVMHHEHHH